MEEKIVRCDPARSEGLPAKKHRPIGLCYVGLVFLVVLTSIAGSCAGDVEERKLGELRAIADQSPVYPDFELFGERITKKISLVYLSRDYKSKARFSDIKAFYDESLSKAGWTPQPESPPSVFVGEKHRAEYRRGEFAIVLEQADDEGTKYAVAFNWKP